MNELMVTIKCCQRTSLNVSCGPGNGRRIDLKRTEEMQWVDNRDRMLADCAARESQKDRYANLVDWIGCFVQTRLLIFWVPKIFILFILPPAKRDSSDMPAAVINTD